MIFTLAKVPSEMKPTERPPGLDVSCYKQKSVAEILHLFVSKETLLLISVRVKISPSALKIMIPLERK